MKVLSADKSSEKREVNLPKIKDILSATGSKVVVGNRLVVNMITAKQPGQKTKPYCRDADDRAGMSKEERNKRARKKRKEDPNPNRTGKAKNVTQESYSNWRRL